MRAVFRALRMQHGVIFAERNNITLRYFPVKGWDISPVLFDSLLWELRGEGLDAYECMDEDDIRAIGEDVWREMIALFEETEEVLGE